ncbi:MAG: hypothetical protein K0R00_1442 [Herbinix sp.]|nr:hypothetical protein [Herbinix sp.]
MKKASLAIITLIFETEEMAMLERGKNKSKDKEKKNKRLDAVKPTNNEGTAAWQDAEEKYKVDNVSKPSIERVVDAKEWVDNGSKL